MNVQDLEGEGEALHQELGREYYLTGAGHRAVAGLQVIYARHPSLLSDEALDCARVSGSRELAEWVVGLRLGRAVAALEERQLAWEQAAVVSSAGRRMPYLRVPIELANLEDRAARSALDSARGALVTAGLTPIRQERLERECEVLRALGYADQVTAASTLSGIDLRALGCDAEAFLESTADLYRDVLARVVRHRLGGAPLSDLLRADAAWAFRVREYDASFSGPAMAGVAERQMADMGLDVTSGGAITFDTDERPGKQPRAFCVPVRVPQEVYLVLRPRGGHADYRTFWHELGHALHFASVEPSQPFAARWLGDNSVTEGYAMLWDHMTIDVAWLRHCGQLSRERAAVLAFEVAVHELYMVRRYAAKLTYELVLHGPGRPAAAAEYADRLTRATLFRYTGDDYLADVDPWFYAARYLRAWQFEAAMARPLVSRFDEDWYRNPRAGPEVQALMSRGQAAPADRLAEDATGAPLSFGPLAARLEQQLS
ncbi:MAG: hypothetical protein A2W29_10610 [Gemmatimonadetes bacterium RBG_16_66_8]|nr:MAG: hypothetical protein A2W29_10610 [Gemmatimonadetes bacterium RBG_16_66_8]